MPSPEVIFKLSNFLALAAWIALVLAPPRFKPRTWIEKGWISTGLSLVYLAGLMAGLAGFRNGGGFSSFAQVHALFQNDWLLLAGWVHYLAFDLLVGASVAQELARANWFFKTACLLLTFFFGPVGWLLSRLFARNQEKLV